MNIPKVIRKYCAKCKTHTEQKVSIYKAGKRRGSARGERRHAERKQGYGGQKFPKLAKPAKVTKKVANAPKVVKSGIAKNKTDASSKLRRDKLNRLKKTGAAKDAASIFKDYL